MTTTIPYEAIIRWTDGANPRCLVRTQTRYLDGYLRDNPAVELGLSDSAFDELKSALSAQLFAERDQALANLAQARDDLTASRAETAAAAQRLYDQQTINDQQIELKNARIAELLAEIEAIRNPPGPDLTTVDGVRAFISDARYAVEIGGISIEGQVISTERDEIGHWFPRFYDAMQWIAGNPDIRAINPAGSYPYKPKHGSPTILTAEQVVRAYQCMAWYINACFAVETQLYAAVVAPGADLSQIVEQARAEATWPQRTFTWQRPQ